MVSFGRESFLALQPLSAVVNKATPSLLSPLLPTFVYSREERDAKKCPRFSCQHCFVLRIRAIQRTGKKRGDSGYLLFAGIYTQKGTVLTFQEWGEDRRILRVPRKWFPFPLTGDVQIWKDPMSSQKKERNPFSSPYLPIFFSPPLFSSKKGISFAPNSSFLPTPPFSPQHPPPFPLGVGSIAAGG